MLVDALLLLIFVAVLALSVAGWLLGPELVTAQRRRRVCAQPFPAAWREILRRRMPMFRRLPADLQLQLKSHTQVLLAEKPFIGCAGFDVTEEVRVLIAAQAALLLLNRRAGYFRNLRQVLVYPGAFVTDREQASATGLVHQTRRVLAGESWQQGQLILSWDDVLEGAAIADDGRNVVIHEFAHQLDQESGRANGAPPLGHAHRYAQWSAVLRNEFDALRRRLQSGETGLIDAYAATDEAEFFAVISEVFFERPGALASAHPALFAELSTYYRTNPLSWS